jgi:AI-2 transport protein TqsA
MDEQGWRVPMEGRGWRLLVGVAAGVVIVAGLRTAAPLIVPLLVALFLSLVAFPFVAFLQRRGAPAWVAVFLVLLAVAAALAGPGLVVRRTAGQFIAAAPRYQERLTLMLVSIQDWLAQQGVQTGEIAATLDPGMLVDLVGFTVTGIATLLSNLFLILLTMSFILLEAASFTRKLRQARSVPEGEADYLSGVPGEVLRYLWLKTLISILTGVLVAIWVGLLGVDFFVLWGFVAFILNYIPNFGSILAALPAVLLAAVQMGPGWALVVALGYVAINLLMGNLLEPILMGRRLGLSPLVVLLSLFFWGWVWGPVGMLLSVPLTMVVKIVMENTPQLRWLAVLLSRDVEAAPPVRP